MSPRHGFRRQPAPLRLAIAALTVVALAGLLLIGDGLYIKAKAHISQALLERSFQHSLAGTGSGKPWPWADFRVIGRISAPRLGKSGIVTAGATGQSLSLGPAWIEASPEPGAEGTSVIAAHRHAHLAWLANIRPGDTLHLDLSDGRRLDFRTVDSRIARWDDNSIDVTSPGRHLVLTTCWPLDTREAGPMRYIVDADLVETHPAVFASLNPALEPGNAR